MDIKVGMHCYVKYRRELGIGKIVSINNSQHEDWSVDIQFKKHKENFRYYSVIASLDTTDLIQVGDYVNGLLVEEIYDYEDGSRTIVTIDGFDDYDEDNIKSIVTKEQFEAVQYSLTQ